MRALADGRVRRSSAEWQAVIAEFEASGLSALAFCRRAGVSRAAFTRWRQQLKGAVSPEAEGAFVEMPTAVPAGTRSLSPGEMELSLPGGVQLRWRP